MIGKHMKSLKKIENVYVLKDCSRLDIFNILHERCRNEILVKEDGHIDNHGEICVINNLENGIDKRADCLYIDLDMVVAIKNNLQRSSTPEKDLGYFIYCGDNLFIRLDSEFKEKEGDTSHLKRMSYVEWVIKRMLE